MGLRFNGMAAYIAPNSAHSLTPVVLQEEPTENSTGKSGLNEALPKHARARIPTSGSNFCIILIFAATESFIQINFK